MYPSSVRIGFLVVSILLASSGCRHTGDAARHEIKNLSDGDSPHWMLANVGQNVCIRAKVTNAYRYLGFDIDKIEGDIIAPYSGNVSTSITQRYAYEEGIELGDVITVCGDLA